MARTDEGLDNWIVQKGLVDSSIFERYLTSLYWIAQTMITVGYGDIPISNLYEQLMAIFSMFAGVIFFSVTVGSLTTIIGEMDKQGLEFEAKLDTLHLIKKNYKLKDEIFNKVHNVIKLMIYRREENHKQFLERLPETL